MEPKREHGDDRPMWFVKPSFGGSRCYVEHAVDVAAMIEGSDPDDQTYTVGLVTITAEEWNAMPEFEGW